VYYRSGVRIAGQVKFSGQAAVVAAWPELPEVVRAGIVAMVKAAAEAGRGS
jgi:hypothetical protein